MSEFQQWILILWITHFVVAFILLFFPQSCDHVGIMNGAQLIFDAISILYNKSIPNDRFTSRDWFQWSIMLSLSISFTALYFSAYENFDLGQCFESLYDIQRWNFFLTMSMPLISICVLIILCTHKREIV